MQFGHGLNCALWSVQTGEEGGLRLASLAVIEDRDAELSCFVGEVVGDAGSGEHDDADRHGLEQLVVALERAAFLCRAKSGLKATCGTFLASAQQAAMRSAPLGEPPCSSTMPGCLACTRSSAAQMAAWSLHS